MYNLFHIARKALLILALYNFACAVIYLTVLVSAHLVFAWELGDPFAKALGVSIMYGVINLGLAVVAYENKCR